jgi:hypothetical protein
MPTRQKAGSGGERKKGRDKDPNRHPARLHYRNSHPQRGHKATHHLGPLHYYKGAEFVNHR